MTYWYNSLRVWISIDQEIRSKDNYKHSFQKKSANGKYYKLKNIFELTVKLNLEISIKINEPW